MPEARAAVITASGARRVALRSPLGAYFALACAISWTLWLPRIASEQGWIARDVPAWWHYAGAAGPVTAALIVARLAEGSGSIRALLAQYDPRSVPAGWFAFALLSPLVLFAAGAGVARVVEGGWPAYADIARTANLPALGLPLTLLVHLLTFGLGEETGWRGFALPRLQARHSALTATLLLAGVWLLWHVPSFWGNAGYADLGPLMLIGWAVGLVLGAVFLTWLYNSTRGGLLAIVLWHGLFNTVVASEAGEGMVAAVVTTGIMVLALFALAVAGPGELRGLSRSAGPRQQHTTPARQRVAAPAGAAPVSTTGGDDRRPR